MPFTLCHPAIVLPLHRYTRGMTSLPALVIGSMAPDFVYFFSLGVTGSFSHSGPGILLYCVPAGAVVYILYFTLLRQPLLAWLPRAISARMAWQIVWPLHDARAVGGVLGSLAIGASTHVFWDSFTHDNTAVVPHLGVLRSLVSIGSFEIPVFKVLQHMSSLVGFIVIATYALAWFARTKPISPYPAPLSARQRFLTFAAVAGAATVGGAAGLLIKPTVSTEHGLFNAVVAGMATAALAIVLLCLAWKASAVRSSKNS